MYIFLYTLIYIVRKSRKDNKEVALEVEIPLPSGLFESNSIPYTTDRPELHAHISKHMQQLESSKM